MHVGKLNPPSCENRIISRIIAASCSPPHGPFYLAIVLSSRDPALSARGHQEAFFEEKIGFWRAPRGFPESLTLKENLAPDEIGEEKISSRPSVWRE